LGIAALVFSAEIAADTIWPGVDGWLCGSLPAVKVSSTWFTGAGQRLFLPRMLQHYTGSPFDFYKSPEKNS
jgi:hypothetical protein